MSLFAFCFKFLFLLSFSRIANSALRSLGARARFFRLRRVCASYFLRADPSFFLGCFAHFAKLYSRGRRFSSQKGELKGCWFMADGDICVGEKSPGFDRNWSKVEPPRPMAWPIPACGCIGAICWCIC